MHEGEPPSESESPVPPGDLERLDGRLRHAKEQTLRHIAAKPDSMPGLGQALRTGIELVSALAVGVGIGFLLDKWLDTAPWFLVVFFFLGAGAGILNVYRAASAIGLAPGYGTPPAGDAEQADEQKNGPA